MKQMNGVIDWTFEPEGDDNPFLESEEAGAPKCIQIDFKVDYTYHPGDPGCRYTANGDGWPPSGPEIELFPHCVKLHLENGVTRLPNKVEAIAVNEWADNFLDCGRHRDRLEELVCEDVADRMIPYED